MKMEKIDKNYNNINYTQELEIKKYAMQMSMSYWETLKNLNECNNIKSWELITQLRENSVLLKKIWNEEVEKRFIDNLQDLNEIITKCSSNLLKIGFNESIMLNYLKDGKIHKEALEQAEIIFYELFEHFAWKNFKISKIKEKIETFWDYPFLETEFYRFKDEEQDIIFRDIYLLCVNYIVSKYKRFQKTNRMCNNFWSEEKMYRHLLENRETREVFLEKNQSKDEEIYTEYVLLILQNIIWKETLSILWDNLLWIRTKKTHSAIKKILKDPKKRIQEINEFWILWDQLWIACDFKNFEELKKTAKFLKKNLTWKFNDRWVLTQNHNNTETMEDMDPFVNAWAIYKNYNLGEISLRQSEKISLWKIKKSYEEEENMYRLFEDLIKKVNSINHEVYKFSQDIKILRILLVEWNILHWKNNKKTAAEKYIKENIQIIIQRLTNILKEINLNINLNNTNTKIILENVILTILEERVGTVITEIARDYLEEHIKANKWYKQATDEEVYLNWKQNRFRWEWLEIIRQESKKNNNVKENKFTETPLLDTKTREGIQKYHKRLCKYLVATNIFYKQIFKQKQISDEKFQIEKNKFWWK